MAGIAETLMLAVGEHRAGRLQRAEQLYRQILRVDPDHADALHLLGVVAHQTGRHGAAVDLIRRAIASTPHAAACHGNLGTAYQALGKLDEAVASYQRALRIDPQYAEGHNNLGNALKAQGRLDEAVASYRRALRIQPDYAKARYNLGNALASQGQLDEAADSYRRVLQLQPDFAEAHYNLGNTLQSQDRLDQAAASYRRALRIRPDYVEAHNNLGNTLEGQGQLDEAAASYRRALQINPDYAEAHNNLATVLKTQGRLDAAVTGYRRALQLKPDYAEAHNNLGSAFKAQGRLDEAAASYRRALQIRPDQVLWELRAATLCPAVFPSNQEIDRYRRRLLAVVKRCGERPFSVDLRQLATSGAEPPLNLMYHGKNDRPIKEAYADLFRRCFPEAAPPVRAGLPRVGFVVSDRHEGVFLRFMQGILEHLNPDFFEAVVICSPAGAARIRAALTNRSIHLLTIPRPLDRIADTIRTARFDLLYHWEVGTDSTNYFLPWLRMAPVQCTSTGIPVTSGIPQMDYYLSSRLLETEGSDDYYTETLLRAKTNLVYLSRASLPQRPKTREAFGFAAGRHLYLCAQKIEKFHPDFDPILAGILRRDGRGVIVIVEDAHAHAAGALRRRFAASIPDVVDRIVFLPRQTYPDYLGLVAAADVLLDTIHYCGGSTTYDGLALGKPVVTLPSQFLAGRGTLGCYRKMEVTDCVAAHPAGYVELAVRLGTDADWRAAVTERIRASSSLLFEDVEAVRELEQLFGQLIERARSA